MEDLESYINCDQLVSVKWFAHTTMQSIVCARKVMEDFKAKNSENVVASYCITGETSDKGFIMTIALEPILDEKKKTFKKISSCQIYSLHKKTQRLTAKNFGARVNTIDQAQAEQLLRMEIPGGDEFASNKAGSIKPKGKQIRVKPPGMKAIQSMASIGGGNSSGSSGIFGSGGLKAMESKLSDKASKSITSKSSTTSAASFFGASTKSSKSSAKPAGGKLVKKGNKSVDKGKGMSGFLADSDDEGGVDDNNGIMGPAATDFNNTTTSTRDLRDADTKKKQIMEDDDEEWDDGTGYTTNKDKLKDRPKAFGMPDGEGGLAQDEVEGNCDEKENENNKEPEVSEVNSPPSGKKKRSAKNSAPIHVHGGIDDWREEDAIAVQQKPKRRKIKTVEKLFTDEKGFIVKRMVQEEVTDDEEEPAPVLHSAPKIKPSPNKSPKKSAPAKKAAPQKGIMGFFGKK